MKYSIDKIVDGIVTLENIETGELVEVSFCELPEGVNDGNVLIKEGNCYIINKQLEKDRKNSLRERMERLKNLKK